MKLISKIHDYYDTPFKASAGDPKYTFVRESKKISMKCTDLQFIEFVCMFGGITKNVDSGVIGFCGKIYPYLRVESYDNMRVNTTTKYYYTWDDFVEENPVIAQGRAKLAKYPLWSNIDKVDAIRKWLTNGQVKKFWSTSDYIATKFQPLLNIFATHRIAYFVIEGWHPKDGNPIIITYPTLKKYSFYKVFDTYAAFQRVEMFLTNDLSKPDDPYIMPVPDKIKAESHGFDKWSFRKMKGESNAKQK